MGLQTASFDSTYLWAQLQFTPNIPLKTIFEGQQYDQLSPREIRRGTLRALNELQPDAVAIYGYVTPDAYAALEWTRQHQRAAVLMSDSNRFDRPSRSPLVERIKSRLIRRYDTALCSGRLAAEYLQVLGLPTDRIFLGYDVVDNSYFSRKAEEVRSAKCEVRSKHGLPERFFLASARFIERKNVVRLIEAYARYRQMREGGGRKTEKTWDLVLLGDGPLRSDLQSQVSTLRLQRSVHLPGFRQIDDLPAYYALARAFVHAPLVEQWGLVVNEAMASGLPVLVSNRCGCAPDLVKDGVNGFTFDPYDVEQLAKLMLKISAFQDVSLSAFGDASRRIIANWGPDRFAAGLKAAVDRALEVGPRRATLLDRLMLNLLIHAPR
jgi:glycosyltransferase involved in cell wall biosynthesis